MGQVPDRQPKYFWCPTSKGLLPYSLRKHKIFLCDIKLFWTILHLLLINSRHSICINQRERNGKCVSTWKKIDAATSRMVRSITLLNKFFLIWVDHLVCLNANWLIWFVTFSISSQSFAICPTLWLRTISGIDLRNIRKNFKNELVPQMFSDVQKDAKIYHIC